jgi:hypothetical protein
MIGIAGGLVEDPAADQAHPGSQVTHVDGYASLQ